MKVPILNSSLRYDPLCLGYFGLPGSHHNCDQCRRRLIEYSRKLLPLWYSTRVSDTCVCEV